MRLSLCLLPPLTSLPSSLSHLAPRALPVTKGFVIYTTSSHPCRVLPSWRVEKTNREKDRLLASLIYFNVRVFVFCWQLQDPFVCPVP